jgi:hypothetical protein
MVKVKAKAKKVALVVGERPFGGPTFPMQKGSEREARLVIRSTPRPGQTLSDLQRDQARRELAQIRRDRALLHHNNARLLLEHTGSNEDRAMLIAAKAAAKRAAAETIQAFLSRASGNVSTTEERRIAGQQLLARSNIFDGLPASVMQQIGNMAGSNAPYMVNKIGYGVRKTSKK